MSLLNAKKFKLAKDLIDPAVPAGTEGFIVRDPVDDSDTYGVRLCGVDLDLLPEFVEVVSDGAAG